MRLKKYFSLVLSLLLILGACNFSGFGAESLPSTKRVLVNVAQNKPITSNQAQESYYPFSNLNDGRLSSFIVPASGANSEKTEITIDLQRKYKIERIELHGRYDGAYDYLGRQHFELIGANKKDFSDGVIIDYMKEQSDEIFPSLGCFSTEKAKNTPYRYIKLKRTGGGYYGYSELFVYAYQNVTEVSRNKSVTTTKGSVYPGERAVNGTNKGETDAWVLDKATEYNYLSVDLGEKQYIGMIELEGRNISTENPATRQNIRIYGSNSIDNLDSLASNSLLTVDDGYKTYTHIGAISGAYYLHDEFPYPKYPGYFNVVCDESEPFRFVTFRNTTLHNSTFGEVRAYVVNPEVLSVNWDEKNLFINFSDEMKESSGDYISLADSEGNSITGSFVDDYTFSVDISSLNKKKSYTLNVSKECENIKNVTMAEDYELLIKSLNVISAEKITFHADKEALSEEVDNLYGKSLISAKTVAQNLGKNTRVTSLYIAVYEDGRLKKVEKTDKELSFGQSEEFISYVTLDDVSDKTIVKAFLWDETKGDVSPVLNNATVYCDAYNIYVSPNGDDANSGSEKSPFKTLKRAKEEVRQRNVDMEKDINVNLSGGMYTLDETLVLDENDSGKNGHFVNYKAKDGEKVIISGGKEIIDWQVYDDEKNIYRAKVSGVDEIRNMYVNGISARTARSKERIKPISMYYENEVLKGYYVSADDVKLYKNASDIRLYYTQVWSYTLCNVEEIIPSGEEGKNIIKMQSKAFDAATDTGDSLPLTSENAFYIENVFELLDEPGEFYYDKNEETVYYMATETENMEQAEVYIPVLDRLLHIEGSDLGNKVKNITFKGLNFAYSSRSDLKDGYVGGQAQSVTCLKKQDTAYPLDNTIVGANIRVLRSENIEFSQNTFCGLSSVALGIYEGSNDIKVEGNAFYDIGDSAVTVGLPSDSYMDEPYYDENGKYLGRNVALYKKAYDSKGNSAISVNDGDVKTVCVTNYISNYIQVDLGNEYEISQVRVPARKNYGANPDVYDSTDLFRRNFRILASKYEDFSDGGVVLGTQGKTAFDVATGFVSDVTTKEKFRYVRIEKTVNEHFPLAELAVISPDQTVPIKEVSKNTLISNNYITRIGEFNLGAPGIQLYYTEGAKISHNTIKDVPYSGICVGWGWLNNLDSTTARDNVVEYNHIENYALRTYDAGGVYLLGTQYNNKVINNFIKNQPNAYYAFYADSGSENFTVTNNVFEHVDMAFALGYVYESTSKKNMTVKDNFSTTPCYTINYTDANSIVEAPTIYLETKAPSAAENIIKNAGLEDSFKSVMSDVPEGRWTLSKEDIYGDIIDHHISKEGSYSGESMPDTTLISYYLSNKIKEAKKVLALGESYAKKENYDALKNAITISENAEKQFKNLGYGYNNTTIAPIDRENLIDVRIALMEEMDRFIESTK